MRGASDAAGLAAPPAAQAESTNPSLAAALSSMAGRTPATQDDPIRDLAWQDPAPYDASAMPPARQDGPDGFAAADDGAASGPGTGVVAGATREAPPRETPPAASAPRLPDAVAAAPAPRPPNPRGEPMPRTLEAVVAAAVQASPEAQPVRAARRTMASWKPVEKDRLDDLRGGFDVGSDLQVSFGIQRAVYINGDLVVATSLTIPNLSRITTDQATRLAAALGVATGAGAAAAATVGNALASHPATAGNGGSGGSGGNGGSSSGAGSAGSGAGAAGTAMTSLPAAMVSAGAATVTTNGVMSLIQNGPGNSAAASALAGSPATVIQNTLNNQSIQSLVTINAGVNTLQAFRAQVAGQTLTNALLGTTGPR
ncbi:MULTISPECIES: flagellin [Cupriavidus]